MPALPSFGQVSNAHDPGAVMGQTVVHFSPHPDDEVIGAPATLMALRDAGYRIVNVACSLGGLGQWARRKSEVAEACQRAGFELLVPPYLETRLTNGGAVVLTHAELVAFSGKVIDELEPELVLSPSPHDRHPYHEAVARAVRQVLVTRPGRVDRWWMWSLWGDLPFPTIGTIFGQDRLEEIVHALGAHGGELERNDYRGLVSGRARMNVSRGAELLFGFNSAAPAADYVELLTEVAPVDRRWLLGRARWLDETAPLGDPTEKDIRQWLFASSVTERFGLPGNHTALDGIRAKTRRLLGLG